MYTVCLKVALILLLVGCWFSMPYGYYELVRFSGLVGFALLAYENFIRSARREALVYVALALLFQPFVKVALGRTIWQLVDGAVALGLVLSLFLKFPRQGSGRSSE